MPTDLEKMTLNVDLSRPDIKLAVVSASIATAMSVLTQARQIDDNDQHLLAVEQILKNAKDFADRKV